MRRGLGRMATPLLPGQKIWTNAYLQNRCWRCWQYTWFGKLNREQMLFTLFLGCNSIKFSTMEKLCTKIACVRNRGDWIFLSMHTASARHFKIPPRTLIAIYQHCDQQTSACNGNTSEKADNFCEHSRYVIQLRNEMHTVWKTLSKQRNIRRAKVFVWIKISPLKGKK